jgi:acetyl esterase/lipase
MRNGTLDFTTVDIEYLRHGDTPLTMRLFRPRAAGPYPVVLDLHGGAWSKGDLGGCQARDEYLAASGIAMAAIDFRQAADGYLATMVDINYAIRWLKAHADEYDLKADRVGITGQSSGGHLAMLHAMRPNDPRYGAQPLAGVDATVRCVGMTWPVINPISRYNHAKRARANAEDWVGDIPERHDIYWRTEAAMIEGNPMLALERGETLATPPAVWVQGRPDIVHDYRDPDSPRDLNEPERFAANYRDAGGDIEIVYVDQENRASETSHAPLAEFFRQHL